EQVDDERLRERSAEGGRHQRQAERAAALGDWQPAPERLRRTGEHAGLADAEEEAQDEERDQSPSETGRRGEERPPDDDTRERDPRAVAVGEPTGGNVEARVGQ